MSGFALFTMAIRVLCMVILSQASVMNFDVIVNMRLLRSKAHTDITRHMHITIFQLDHRDCSLLHSPKTICNQECISQVNILL